MTSKEAVMREIDALPAPLVEEVLDFARFLRGRAVRKGSEAALLSEAVLAKDWLRPEEDAAWQDL